jgi:hypothetical protein
MLTKFGGDVAGMFLSSLQRLARSMLSSDSAIENKTITGI